VVDRNRCRVVTSRLTRVRCRCGQLCATETLEANLSNITVKKFDMDFDVDPMFHKVGASECALQSVLSVLGRQSIVVADVQELRRGRRERHAAEPAECSGGLSTGL
jgi:hypothetical protein